MKKKNTLRNIIILVVVLALLWLLYTTFFGSSDIAILDQGAGSVGADLVVTFNKLERIKFDSNLFTTPSYSSLVDFSIDIPPQPISRPNPFAAIGRN